MHIGSFRAAIGGAFTALVDGPASAAPRPVPALPGVALHLHGETEAAAIDLLFLGEVLPAGVRPVADLFRGNPAAGEWVAIVSRKGDPRMPEPFFSMAGQVRVSSISGERLSGTFALEARAGTPLPGHEDPWISVASDFTARPMVSELPMFAGALTWEWDFTDIAEGVD